MDLFDLRNWKGFRGSGGNLSCPAQIDHIAIDSRRIFSGHTLFAALKGSRTDGHNFLSQADASGVKYALVKKDYNPSQKFTHLTLLKVEDPLQALQEIAGCYRSQFHCPVIAVVGSYGKTQVKDLLQEILNKSYKTQSSPESFNSQIGVPLSLIRISKVDRFAIIEASVSKVGEMERLKKIISPDHVILTHAGRKHLEGFGSLETLASEMLCIAKGLPKGSFTLLPSEKIVRRSAQGLQNDCIFWNEPNEKLPHALRIPSDDRRSLWEISFPDGNRSRGIIRSGHYYFLDLVNIAVKAAWLLGSKSSAIQEIMETFAPEPIRTEIWQNPHGGTIINEQYCSDPQSVDSALRHFEKAHPKGKKIFLFSGIRSSSPHIEKEYERIGEAIGIARIDELHLQGDSPFQPLILKLQNSPAPEKIYHHPNEESAFNVIKNNLKPFDTVLVKGSKKYSVDQITAELQGSISTNQCFINLAAVATNIARLKRKLGSHVRIMPMIKAAAYGTDNLIMAKFLASLGIDIFGVSYVDEAVLLRNGGITQHLFTLNATHYEVKKAVEFDLEIGVSDLSLIGAIGDEAERQGKIIKVHLHIDTGMSRLGCRKEEALRIAKEICCRKHLKLEGLMSHFASAEAPDEDPFSQKQIELFEYALEEIEGSGILIPWKHAANSSASLRFDLPKLNMARLGLSLYGLSSSSAAAREIELKLAISLQSRIAGINFCKKGETVSYGRHYTIEKETQKLAVIPIGYFDGIHRNYSGKGSVIIHGKIAPMVGNICMDYLMADITEIPYASVGDPVLIFGEDEEGNYLSPERLAFQGNSIPHELITCLGPRIQRIFTHEESVKSF